jgi:hypothetical protein
VKLVGKQSPFVKASLINAGGAVVADARTGTVIRGGKFPKWDTAASPLVQLPYKVRSLPLCLWWACLSRVDALQKLVLRTLLVAFASFAFSFLE